MLHTHPYSYATIVHAQRTRLPFYSMKYVPRLCISFSFGCRMHARSGIFAAVIYSFIYTYLLSISLSLSLSISPSLSPSFTLSFHLIRKSTRNIFAVTVMAWNMEYGCVVLCDETNECSLESDTSALCIGPHPPSLSTTTALNKEKCRKCERNNWMWCLSAWEYAFF